MSTLGKHPKCSFCSKTRGQVEALFISGPSACICNECVTSCIELLHKEGWSFNKIFSVDNYEVNLRRRIDEIGEEIEKLRRRYQDIVAFLAQQGENK